MKPIVLHAVPFACSLAVHLELVRHDLPHEVVWHPRGGGRRVTDEALAVLNLNRRVPTLVERDGTVHKETVAVLHHLETAHGSASLSHLEDLSFVATELHAPILAILFDTEAPDACRNDVVSRVLPGTLRVMEARLEVRPFTGGAAAYLFWALLLLDVGAKGSVQGAATRSFQSTYRGKVADTVLDREHAARKGLSDAR